MSGVLAAQRCALAGHLPAPVLAELLGLSISAATGWVALAARDEAHYLEARVAKPPQQRDGLRAIPTSADFDVGARNYPLAGNSPISWSGKAMRR